MGKMINQSDKVYRYAVEISGETLEFEAVVSTRADGWRVQHGLKQILGGEVSRRTLHTNQFVGRSTVAVFAGNNAGHEVWVNVVANEREAGRLANAMANAAGRGVRGLSEVWRPVVVAVA